MLLVDVHTHLDHPDFDDLDKVIEAAKKVGVKAIVTNGVNNTSNRKVLELAKKYDIVKAALGIYPIEALQNEVKQGQYPRTSGPFDIDEEIEFIEKNKNNIAAIGEVGLDFKNTNEVETQTKLFGRFIELSEKLRKPIIVHSRKAEGMVVDMLNSSSNKKIILHCFCGKKRFVKKAIDAGWFFSIPTNVVKSQQFQELVGMAPMSQLFTETDAPYLAPYPNMRNEPAFIVESIKKIATIKKMEQQEVANIIYNNYQRIFE